MAIRGGGVATAVELVELLRGGDHPQHVVVIWQLGSDEPRYWIPFPGAYTHSAYALNDHEVFAFHSHGYGCRVDRLAICDPLSPDNTRHLDLDPSYAGPCALTVDRPAISYFCGANELVVWNSELSECVGHFTSIDAGSLRPCDPDRPIRTTSFAVQIDGRISSLASSHRQHVHKDTICSYFMDGRTWLISHERDFMASLERRREVEKLAAKFSNDAGSFHHPVAKMSAVAVCASLRALAERVETTGFEGMARDRQLFIVFDVGKKPIPEHKFFEKLEKLGMVEAVPALRRLVLAFLNRNEFGEGEWPTSRSCAVRFCPANAGASRQKLD
jgi:hypothetical protein